MQISVLVGNPKPRSRTLSVAEALSARLSGEADVVTTIDLADHANELFAWPSAAVDRLAKAVAASEIAIVASPTYKAAYTGLLKSFLDRYPADGLHGVAAIPLMTGADRGHSMAPDSTLRPLLAELGASVATASLYVDMPSLPDLDRTLDEWVRTNGRLLRSAMRTPEVVSAS